MQKRKQPAHPPPVRRHNTPIILFVTVCSKQRQPIFDNPDVQRTLCNVWSEAGYWTIGYYLLMPDHIHLFCSPGRWELSSIKKWVGYWKRRTSIDYPLLRTKWLTNCWDTQMRSQEIFRTKLDYVRENPVRAGLVEKSEIWPYQGSLHDLAWVT